MFLSKTLGPRRHPYIVISFTLKVTDQLFETPQAWSPSMSTGRDYVKIGTSNIESQI